MTTCILLMTLLMSDGEAVAEPVIDKTAWASSIREVFDQLNTLDMFSTVTSFGGVTIKIPRELQKVPARMIEGMDDLQERGIEISLKEVQFRDLKFIYDKHPEWPEERPLIPTLVEFRQIAFEADAKTRLGTIPVGATFRDGQLPVEFLPILGKGYDLLVMPESKADQTRIENVKLKIGGGLTSSIANHFFSDKVARLILEHGVGQTLQMGQGDLISADAASRLLNVKPDSRTGRAVETIVDILGR